MARSPTEALDLPALPRVVAGSPRPRARPAAAPGATTRPGRGWRRGLSRGTLVAAGLLALLACLALAPDLLAPNPPERVDLARMLEPPSPAYPLGTDAFGRCLLSRLIFGARATLGSAVAVLATTIVLSGLIGGAAALTSGRRRPVFERLLDLGLALPTPVVAIAVVGLLGPGLLNGMVAVGATSWAGPARIIRALLRGEVRAGHVVAARSLGAPTARIVVRHLLPGIAARATVVYTLQLGQIMLALSALSFLGLGPQPPTAEWAAMLNEGRALFLDAPALMLLPGGAITLTVAACTLLADGLSARLDRPGGA